MSENVVVNGVTMTEEQRLNELKQVFNLEKNQEVYKVDSLFDLVFFNKPVVYRISGLAHPVKDSIRIFRVIAGGFIRFMGASLFCFLIDQALAGLLRDWLLPLLGLERGSLMIINLSGWLARLVSAIVNFRINKDLVFRMKGNARNAAWKYTLLCLAIITVSNVGVWLLGKIGVAGWLAKILMDFVLYFVSYQVQDKWVFKEIQKE